MIDQQEEVDMADGEHGPPLLDANSFINISSSSSEDTASQPPVPSVVLPAGPLIQAQDIEVDQQLEDIIESSNPALSHNVAIHEENATVDDSLFLPDNVNLVPPNEAHLQLLLGRVQTHFFAVPEEHDLTRRFSTEGLLLWEKYFAPHMHGHSDHNGYAVVDIPVSWFNFITLMLLTPEKFDWANGFLSSYLWDILKEPIMAEDTVKFAIPDKCVTTKAPLCLAITDMGGLDNPTNKSPKWTHDSSPSESST
jgi:hypothetical protein